MFGKRMVWIVAAVLLASLTLSACSQATARPAASVEEPSKLEPIEGTELSRVILTERAAERLGIETDQVREVEIEGERRMVVPYAAVLYTEDGETWVYTNPEPLVFVRQAITVERIEGDQAILADGPPVGTPVVTAGTAELFGIEFGVGH
ncbi:hypothetical protein HRbin26_02441 [bacterium HR26]|nr:hypothetical protein HRbin26_02441 [bacterium HR26]